MRFNFATTQEIETLQKLTAAGCSVTPRLLGVKTDVQDTLVSASRTKTPLEAEPVHEIDWWMPGGYIVYILMAKLQAEPLSMYKYWYLFTKQDRDDIRAAFRKSYMLVAPIVPDVSIDGWQRAQKVRHGQYGLEVGESDVGQEYPEVVSFM